MCNIRYVAQGVVCKQKGGGGECCAPNSQNGKRKQSHRRARATHILRGHAPRSRETKLTMSSADKVPISKDTFTDCPSSLLVNISLKKA